MEAIKRAGARPTPQRRAVCLALARLDHPSAEAVWREARKVLPEVSLATVYNTVALLGKAGEAYTIEVGSGAGRYEVRNLRPHAHFYCRSCGRIWDLPLPPDLGLPLEVGTEVESTTLVVKGKCPTCARAGARPEEVGEA